MRQLGFILSILTAIACISGSAAQAGIALSISIAPPPLPVYEQPPIPGPDYIWTPGYWAWDEDVSDYYWVAGVWTEAPEPGLLWTPGYWGWNDNVYVFHDGYWGESVGYYGGISYGYGYTGVGYYGGYWSGRSFYYNRSVTNISNTTIINNTYNKTVINNNNTKNISFNGPGGIQHQPTADEKKFSQERKIPPTSNQKQFFQQARTQDGSHFKTNQGAPRAAAATSINNPKFVAAKSAGQPGGMRNAARSNLKNGGGNPGNNGERNSLRSGPQNRPSANANKPSFDKRNTRASNLRSGPSSNQRLNNSSKRAGNQGRQFDNPGIRNRSVLSRSQGNGSLPLRSVHRNAGASPRASRPQPIIRSRPAPQRAAPQRSAPRPGARNDQR